MVTEGWWSEDVKRKRGREEWGGYTESTMGELQKSEKGSENGYHEREE